MFHLFVVLCMLSYDGEVCKTLESERTFDTKTECTEYADKSRQDFNDRKINMVRIKEMRCMKPVPQDGM